jgi:hypothetical protein
VTVVVVLTAKFLEGAWVTVLLIPSLLTFMIAVHRQYLAVAREVELKTPLDLSHLTPPIVIVPIQQWSKIAQKGLRFAVNLSTDVHVLQRAAVLKAPTRKGQPTDQRGQRSGGISWPEADVARSPRGG